MSKKLTVLVTPVEWVGHVMSSIGVAEALRDRGHRIIFVVEKEWEGRLKSYGFEEEILQIEQIKNIVPGENLAKQVQRDGLLSHKSSFDKMKALISSKLFYELIEKKKYIEPQLRAIVNKYNPDVILIDDAVGCPSLIYSNKPWVLIASTNPLTMIENERTPPGWSGYPINGDKTEWKKYRETRDNLWTPLYKIYDDWMSELGLPIKDNNRHLLIPASPYLNIYGFPEELDYTDVRSIPNKWFRVDTFARKGDQEFKFPENLKNRDQDKEKLVYFSLGSMGSIDIEFMKRLIKILSKSSHKFIVSKGVSGDKYELADNMWGQNSVPQLKVLPLVDLVITHGGNNTLTETFSFGKPMIVMPLFGDQFDNAQRIQLQFIAKTVYYEHWLSNWQL